MEALVVARRAATLKLYSDLQSILVLEHKGLAPTTACKKRLNASEYTADVYRNSIPMYARKAIARVSGHSE